MSANSTSTSLRFREYAGDAITKLPPKPWLIDQIVGENDFVMIFGQSGSGKSFMVIELAMCGITGKTYAGHSKRRSSITVAHECDEETAGLPRRLRHAAQWFSARAADGKSGHGPDSPHLRPQTAWIRADLSASLTSVATRSALCAV